MKAGIVSLLAALAGASVAAVSASTRDWLVAVVGAAVAFEVVALRTRIEQDADSGAVRAWRRLELLAIPLFVAGLQLVTGSGFSLGAEFAIAAVFGGVVWALVNTTLVDLDAIDRAIDDTDGISPIQRIRLRLVAIGLVAVACGALGTVGVDGLLDLTRPAATRWTLAPFGFWVVGLVALGAVARLAESRRWARDGVSVDTIVSRRWANAVLVTVSGVGILAFAIASAPSGVSALPVRGLLETGRLGSWLGDRASGMRDSLGGPATMQDPVPAGPAPTLPRSVPADPVAPWLGDVALWVFVVLVFGFAVAAGRSRRERPEHRDGVTFLEVVRHVFGAITELVASLWSALRRWLRAPRHAAGASAAEVPQGAERRHRWLPHDPVRRRIAEAYWRSVGVVSATQSPPRRPETPREFAHRVDDERFRRMTSLFEEARYSNHVLPPTSATTAESVAGELDS